MKKTKKTREGKEGQLSYLSSGKHPSVKVKTKTFFFFFLFHNREVKGPELPLSLPSGKELNCFV